jgi:hypothetical protein
MAKMGAPSKYTPELLEKAWNYVRGGWIEAEDAVPSIEGLCCEIGISVKTAYNWEEDEDKDFLQVLDTLRALQGRGLINNGLKGAFNPSISKMLLTKHGYSDKIEQDNTSSDGSMTPTFNTYYEAKPEGLGE